MNFTIKSETVEAAKAAALLEMTMGLVVNHVPGEHDTNPLRYFAHDPLLWMKPADHTPIQDRIKVKRR